MTSYRLGGAFLKNERLYALLIDGSSFRLPYSSLAIGDVL